MTRRTKVSSRVALIVEVDHRNFIMTFHEQWYRVERSGQLLKAKEFGILVIGWCSGIGPQDRFYHMLPEVLRI